ncbi:MAG TPA: winged helix-turn-helix domain-containing protein [Nitrososphaeraceae archaeon]|nr:winged helix-turn-helix domain-containing protein [Nitrososphaeraceae archaeon]
MTVISEQHELILPCLRQDTARDIIIYLIEHTGSTQSDIAKFKNLSAPTINWHMSRLIEAGVVISTREWKTVRYFIENPESLIESL